MAAPKRKCHRNGNLLNCLWPVAKRKTKRNETGRERREDEDEDEDESKTKRGEVRRNETKESLKQSTQKRERGGGWYRRYQPFGNNPQTAHNALR